VYAFAPDNAESKLHILRRVGGSPESRFPLCNVVFLFELIPAFGVVKKQRIVVCGQRNALSLGKIDLANGTFHHYIVDFAAPDVLHFLILRRAFHESPETTVNFIRFIAHIDNQTQ
jgi:hypothetical protein